MPSAVRSINAAEVYAESLRNELNSYTYQPILEGTDEFSALKTLYDDFLKNGNLEKFYSKYYATVPLKSTRFFCGLSRNSLLARILKMGVQILSGPKAHLTWRRRRHVSWGVWGHAPPRKF